MLIEKNRQFIVPCSCHDIYHLVNFEVSHYPQHNDKDIWVSFVPRPKTLFQKLKFMWYILMGKEWLFNDMMIDDKYVHVFRDVVDYYEQDLSVYDGSKEGIVTE